LRALDMVEIIELFVVLVLMRRLKKVEGEENVKGPHDERNSERLKAMSFEAEKCDDLPFKSCEATQSYVSIGLIFSRYHVEVHRRGEAHEAESLVGPIISCDRS
jgi:hypothetical protein